MKFSMPLAAAASISIYLRALVKLDARGKATQMNGGRSSAAGPVVTFAPGAHRDPAA